MNKSTTKRGCLKQFFLIIHGRKFTRKIGDKLRGDLNKSRLITVKREISSLRGDQTARKSHLEVISKDKKKLRDEGRKALNEEKFLIN